jgi:hypothetical protein
MPHRCQGTPDGPCPKDVCNRTVKHTQGDLFLCPSCEAIRFPPTPQVCSGMKLPRAASAAAGKKRSANTVLTDRPKFGQKPTASLTKAEDEFCADCNDILVDNVIECEICQNTYHPQCSGLSQETFDILQKIIKETGWVCQPCRTEHNSRLNKLHGALTQTHEEMADMRVSIAWLQQEIENLKTISAASRSSIKTGADIGTTYAAVVADCDRQSKPNNIHHASNRVAVSDISIEIHRTINEVARRKSNVVITRLPEPTGNTDEENKFADEETFKKLCEENLSLKPSLARKGCKRLGQLNTTDGRPRRLLVHLSSDANASNLLAVTRQLRHSSDSWVANNVYINADLAPAEARLAYEERQRRKAAVAARRDTDQQRSACPAVMLNGEHERDSNSNNADRTKQQVDCSLPNNNETEPPFRTV